MQALRSPTTTMSSLLHLNFKPLAKCTYKKIKLQYRRVCIFKIFYYFYIVLFAEQEMKNSPIEKHYLCSEHPHK